ISYWLWIPIILVYTNGINSALLWFFILFIPYEVLIFVPVAIVQKRKFNRFPIEYLVNELLTVLTILQYYFLFFFDFNINLDHITFMVYNQITFYPFYFAVLTPVAILSLFATNTYLLMNFIVSVFRKKIK